MKPKLTPELRSLFRRYGRLHSKPKRGTHRGWEVRFHFDRFHLIPMYRRFLERHLLDPGTAWQKNRMNVLPLYGRAAYQLFSKCAKPLARTPRRA